MHIVDIPADDDVPALYFYPADDTWTQFHSQHTVTLKGLQTRMSRPAVEPPSDIGNVLSTFPLLEYSYYQLETQQCQNLHTICY